MPGFQFRGIQFDVEKGQLTQDGRTQDLRPKTADLMRLLIERREQVVSKEDLFAAIWPDTVVSDATLVQSIQELRKALGDDAREPLYIKTFPRRGYGWIHPVTEITDRPAPASATIDPVPPRRSLGNLAALIIGALLLIAVVWVALQNRSEAPVADGPAVVETAQDQDRYTLLVLPFRNTTGRDELAWPALGLRDLVQRGLAERLPVDRLSDATVFAAGSRVNAFEAQDEEALTALLEALGARYVIKAQLVEEHAQVRFSYQIYGRDGLVSSGKSDYPKLMENIPQLVADMSSAMSGQQKPPEPAESLERVGPVQAAYIQTYNLYLERGPGPAREGFADVVDMDPNHLEARIWLAWCRLRGGDIAGAKAEYNQLLARSQGKPRPTARAYWGLGILHHWYGDLEEAGTYLKQARGHALESGDPVLQANITRSLANLRLALGYTKEHEALSQQARQLIAHMDDPGIQASDLYNLGSVNSLGDDSPSNLRLLEAALEIYEEIGDGQGRASTLAALSYHRLVPLEERRRMRQETITLARERGDRLTELARYQSAGIATIFDGDTSGAREQLQQSLAYARQIGLPLEEGLIIYGLGVVNTVDAVTPGNAKREEHTREAKRHLSEAERIFLKLGRLERRAPALMLLGMFDIREGKLARAEERFGTARVILNTIDIPEALYMCAVAQATLAIKTGRPETVPPMMQEILTLFPRLNPLAYEMEARALYQMGRHQEARTTIEKAVTLMGDQAGEIDQQLLLKMRAAAEGQTPEALPPMQDLLLNYLRFR